MTERFYCERNRRVGKTFGDAFKGGVNYPECSGYAIFDRQRSHETPIATCTCSLTAERITEALNRDHEARELSARNRSVWAR